MGGTTAKLCLIDRYRPQTARKFEIARAARFIKGSGMPVRIPVIEMIEIGAGGGSIAHVDRLGRLTGRTRERGVRARTGRLCQRRHRADGDRCRCDPGADRTEALRRGAAEIDMEAAETALASGVGQALGA